MDQINLVLVDEENNQVGIMEKMEAHEKWLLHRAFSIFLFNDKQELLIQRRAQEKYHCGGMWANTVCSHQFPNEWNLEAAKRRLVDELWIQVELSGLEELGSVIYRAEFDNGLTEHEYDFVIKWNYNWDVIPNSEEVMDFKWIGIDELKNDIKTNPEIYTPWLKVIMNNKKYF